MPTPGAMPGHDPATGAPPAKAPRLMDNGEMQSTLDDAASQTGLAAASAARAQELASTAVKTMQGAMRSVGANAPLPLSIYLTLESFVAQIRLEAHRATEASKKVSDMALAAKRQLDGSTGSTSGNAAEGEQDTMSSEEKQAWEKIWHPAFTEVMQSFGVSGANLLQSYTAMDEETKKKVLAQTRKLYKERGGTVGRKESKVAAPSAPAGDAAADAARTAAPAAAPAAAPPAAAASGVVAEAQANAAQEGEVAAGAQEPAGVAPAAEPPSATAAAVEPGLAVSTPAGGEQTEAAPVGDAGAEGAAAAGNDEGTQQTPPTLPAESSEPAAS